MTYSFSIQQEADSSHKKTASKFREETSKVLNMEHSFVWCWNLDTSENRSEIPGQLWNVVPKEAGVDQFDRGRSEEVSLTVKEGRNILSHLPQELPSKTQYRRKDEGTLEAMGRHERRRKQLLDDLK